MQVKMVCLQSFANKQFPAWKSYPHPLKSDYMVKSLLSLLSTRQNSILSGAAILMAAVFASKFLGLIKDRILVHNFDSSQAAIFFAAFRLPDLIFQLLIFGTLSVAFIPVFTDYLNRKGEEEGYAFASNILNLSLASFFILGSVAFVFVGPINNLIVPGFTGNQKEMTDELTRIILFGQLLLVVGSFFVGITQSYQRFIIPSLAPIFYNLGIIFGIAVLAPIFGIKGAAYGVILGSLMHMLIQLPLVHSLGFHYHISFDFLNQGVREVFKLMSMRNIGLIAEQLNDTVSIALASLISYSSVTLLTFASHLHVAPIGLFGATIAQAALPVLSREFSRKEGESFKITLLTTMHQILFLTLPAAAILIVLRIPVVRLVFGAPQFSWEDTVLTGKTVAFLAVGLAAQSVILLLVRGFYAFKDVRIPVLVSLGTVLLNILLSLYFVTVLRFDVWGLGLSYAIATNLSFFILLYFLNKKVGGFNLQDLIRPALKMLLAAVISAIALYIPIKALDQVVFDTTRTVNLIILTSIASIFGLSIYLILVWLMKVKELETYINLLKKFSRMEWMLKSEEIVKETGSV